MISTRNYIYARTMARRKIDKVALANLIRELDGLDNEQRADLLSLLNERKTFGLVWEEKTEEAQERMCEELPVLKEDVSKRLIDGGDDAPNHGIIEADNIHAITALMYSHEGKFDAIYIDPPYNSGATDWKYNNDYVDKEDDYKHSKWLDMMKHRLLIAKKLLNQENSVLIVTIDEKEFIHLGCLLEEVFPNGRMQMISTVINVKGVAREREFSRVNEYIYIVQLGESKVESIHLSSEWLGNVRNSGRDKLRLGSMLRSGSNSERSHSPGCFYPMIFSKTGQFLRSGESIPIDQDKSTVIFKDDEIGVWPIHTNGQEGVWQYSKSSFDKLVAEGFVYFGKLKNGRVGISYAPKGVQQKIKDGLFKISGTNEDGSIKIDDSDYESTFIPGNQWSIPSHNATEYGSKLLKDMFGNKIFSYPKSLYAVQDTLRFFVINKSNAKILDFFAGSGTTLHATMLLNQEDGGHRQCFLVSNNENNICEEVTYERNKRVIEGYTTPKGEYVEGLKDNNLRYYKVDFVPRDSSVAGKRKLMEASTDLVCIKHDVYQELDTFGSLSLKPHIARYFAEKGKQILIIYKSESIEYFVKEIAQMPEDTNILVYVFSTNNYALEADFEDVADKVTLCALPAAVYNAYLKVLPKKKVTTFEEENEVQTNMEEDEQ